MAILFIIAVAFLLSGLGLDQILIEGINQVLHTNFGTPVYWLIFFIIGVIVQIIKALKK